MPVIPITPKHIEYFHANESDYDLLLRTKSRSSGYKAQLGRAMNAGFRTLLVLYIFLIPAKAVSGAHNCDRVKRIYI